MSKNDDAPDWKIDYHVMYGRTIAHKPDTPRPLNRNTLEYRVKDLLFADPNLSVGDIMEKLGTIPSSKIKIILLRENYLHTVAFLIRQGATGVRGRDRRPGRSG